MNAKRARSKPARAGKKKTQTTRRASRLGAPDLEGFDPAAPIPETAGLFGLSTSRDESLVHVVPAPVEITVSYRRGTSRAPRAILAASHQLDLFDIDTGRPYEKGIALLPEASPIKRLNAAGVRRVKALGELEKKNQTKSLLARIQREKQAVNRICAEIQDHIHDRVAESIDAGHLVGVVGGDHSVAFGSIRAHARAHPGLGVLSFDAHHDLREAYEGYTWSHASVFFNVLRQVSGVKRIVQVGVRDYAETEREICRRSRQRVLVHDDRALARAVEDGTPFGNLARRIVQDLPHSVYVSFDIDGLAPHLCPNTGTPVPGGLEFHQALRILEEVVRSGRQIVGFDLVEVAPGKDEWDANVGARVLYKLIGFAVKSRG